VNWNNGIAITGIALDLPKCNSVKSFWDILINGRCVLNELPLKRYEYLLQYRSINPTLGHISDMQASFMDAIDTFDNSFFHISPGDALQMDPCQRKCMEVIWHALEDAACTETSLAKSKTGVFIGCASEPEYKQMMRAYGYKPSPSSVLGNCFAALSGHISHYLDLKGPNMVINTVCSSSLIAIYMASMSLLNEESDIAVAGGCELRVLPHRMGMFGIESSDGITRTFDALSDGTGTGEGVAAVVLKRYDDAIKDCDKIYAVIKSGEVNHDGRCMSLSAPNPNSQYELVKNAWRNAKINPEDIGYIEAHGTGTSLGDPIEYEALSKAFADFSLKRSFCGIGSVKSNIGHLDSAAGIAGFIKATLCLYYKRLVPSLHFQYPNKEISFLDSPFYVNDKTRHWEATAGSRLCGVSSFGLTGTNCHMILQESNMEEYNQNVDMQWYILTISAKTEVALKQLIDLYRDLVIKLESWELQSLCYTSNIRRTHFEHKFACVAYGVKSLISCLSSFESKVPAINDINYMNSKGNLCCELAGIYLAGGNPDWLRLYNNNIRACSTPGYPFERNPFWPLPKFTVSNNDRQAIMDVPAAKQKNDTIIDVIKNTLGYDTIDGTKSFQEIGGSSIHIMQIAQHLKEEFDISFTTSELLEAPSIIDFCRLLEINRTDSDEIRPSVWKASKLQKRYFLSNLRNKKSLTNILVNYVVLPLESSNNKIIAVLNDIINEHEIFRTTFHRINGIVSAIVGDKTVISMKIHEDPIVDKELENIILESGYSISPDKLPLIRFHLYCTATHKLLVAIYHRLVCDGNSMQLLFDSFLQTYLGKAIKRNVLQFQDIVGKIDKEATDDAKHISELLKSMNISVNGILQKYGNSMIIELSNVYDPVDAFIKKYKIGILSFFTVICMLSRMFQSNETQFIFGIVFPGRESSEYVDVIGPFSNIVPFQYILNEETFIINLFYDVDRLINQLRRYQGALFEDIYSLNGVNYMREITDIISISVGNFGAKNEDNPVFLMSSMNFNNFQEKRRSDIYWDYKNVIIHTFQGCGFSISKESDLNIQKIIDILDREPYLLLKDIIKKD